MRIKRPDQIFLAFMAALTGVVLLGGQNVGLPVMVATMLAFVAAIGLVAFRPALDRIREQTVAAASGRPTGTQAAQEAAQRVRARGVIPSVGVKLADVGLIVSETTSDGVTFRRTREVDHDDDGVRPYVQLDADALGAERRAVVRYEMIDPTGEPVFVHEDVVYLQLGENVLHPTRHLPLAGGLDMQQLGRWDLHVILDGELMGMLNFAVTPSDEERRSRLAGRAEPGATSFEDLLRRGSRSGDNR